MSFGQLFVVMLCRPEIWCGVCAKNYCSAHYMSFQLKKNFNDVRECFSAGINACKSRFCDFNI